MQAQEIDILALEKKQSTSSNALMQQDVIITQIELYFLYDKHCHISVHKFFRKYF